MPFRALLTLSIAALMGSSFLSAEAVERPDAGASEKLLTHQSVFQPPRLIEVSEHVTVAYGYTMSNIVMIEGDDGIFIFDTGMRVEKAALALKALRTRTSKPILGVAYSHGHGDHTGGVRAFIPEGSDIPLYAHRNALRYLGDVTSPTADVFRLRAVQQLGLILPEGVDGTVGSGGGPVINLGGTVSYLTPTHLFDDEVTIDLGGTTVKLFHAPGDLDDGIGAWVEEDGVLSTGDTVVGTKTHPILSTPRYEKGRDAEAYIASINHFRDFGATHLVGGHGLPINGAENVSTLIDSTLLVGRYIMDETLRQIDAGATPAQTAAALRIPAGITSGEEFDDYYHRLNWIVRGVYNKEMGWYGGDTLELVALAPKDRASKLIEALGGAESVQTQAEAAYNEGDYRWAAELATELLLQDENNAEALSIKANSLRGVAYQSDSANERNYLLTEADLMLGDIGMNVIFGQAFARVTEFFSEPKIPDLALAGPSSSFISKLRVRSDVGRPMDEDISVAVQVTDREESFQLTLTKGVMIHDRAALRAPDATLTLDHRSLILLADARVTWDNILDRDAVSVSGDETKLQTFFEHLNWD